MQGSPKRVIVSAYACEPWRGSEPGVGWNWVCQLAAHHSLWVITRANNQGVIEQFKKDHGFPEVNWIYYDLPNWLKSYKKLMGLHVYYTLWQFGAYLQAKKYHRTINFELSHHITFVNYWMPIFIPLLPIPFVWGPLGGGESTPRSLLKLYSGKDLIHEISRILINAISLLNPWLYFTANKANVSIAVTADTAKALLNYNSMQPEILTQVIMSREEITSLGQGTEPDNSVFSFLCIGQLRQLKGFSMAVNAFFIHQKQFPNSRMLIIGSGNEHNNLQNLIIKKELQEKVFLKGNLPREEVIEILKKSHVLVHPSMHDSGGFVCCEAMAAGKPVICLDTGGSAQLVSPNCGILIKPTKPEEVINSFALAMEKLESDKNLFEQMSKAGKIHVSENFCWDTKINDVLGFYEKATR